MKASWRTTLFGSGGLVVVIAGVLSAIFDNDPATNPDWTAVSAALAACIGLLFARDNLVSSEQAGAATTPK